MAQTSATPVITADAIMQRVAANQDRANQDRTHYVFVQHARIRSQRGSRVLCDEVTDTRVTPERNGTVMHLVHLTGHAFVKGSPIDYDHLLDPESAPDWTPPPPQPTSHADDPETAKGASRPTSDSGDDLPMDVDLVEHLRKDLLYSHSKDGVNAGLFPLTTGALKDYNYRLIGPEQKNGRSTFHIAFTPKDGSDFGWRGDAWIDQEAFQPVFVQTALSRKVPFAVRTLLGTNVPGLGFSVIYAPGPDGVWFPQTFGSEFRMRVLFFLARSITISAENRDFQRTHVTSRIVRGSAEPPQP